MSAVIRNKKAYHDYFIIEQIEAGMVLAGSEVKSLRNGRANLKDSFVRIINNEAFVFGMHLTYHHTTNPYFKPDEKRARKLLLHKKHDSLVFSTEEEIPKGDRRSS